MRNWLRHLTGDPSRADDLAQETFIRAWERLHTISDGKSFKAWVMKIAYNMFLQSHRRQSREARLAALTEEERIAMVLCYAYG